MKRLALVVLFAFCARLPAPTYDPGLVQLIESACEITVESAAAAKTDAEIGELLEASAYLIVPLFHRSNPYWKQFRRVLFEFVKEEMGRGVLPIYACHGASLVAEHTWYPEMTPGELKDVLSASVKASAFLQARSDKAFAVVPWEEIPLSPKGALLKGSVGLFRRTNLPVLAVSAETAMRTQVDNALRTYTSAIVSGLVPVGPEHGPILVSDVIELFATAAERYGAYNPSLKPRGILLASYFVLPTPDEYAMHEIAHVAQDVSWHLHLLLYMYHDVVVPRVGGSLKRQVLTAGEVHRLEMTIHEFLNITLDRSHRQGVLRLGRELGLTELEWQLFFDIVQVVKELDAYGQQAALAKEKGRNPAEFSTPDRLYDNVVDILYKRDNRVSPLIELVVARRDFFFELVKMMNETRSFRQSVGEWWAELWNWRRPLNRAYEDE